MIAVPSARGAGHGGGGAEHGREDHLGGGAALGAADPAEMPARDVPDFVGDHAGQLARRARCA